MTKSEIIEKVMEKATDNLRAHDEMLKIPICHLSHILEEVLPEDKEEYFGKKCPSCKETAIFPFQKCCVCGEIVCGVCVHGEAGRYKYYCKSCWEKV